MKRLLHLSSIVLLILLLSVSFPVLSKDTPTIAGHWEGAIEIPGMKLNLDIDFWSTPNGTWKGDISIPVQNAKDLPLADISVNGLKVAFIISKVPGEPTFKGVLSEDGSKINGEFTQAGKVHPFYLNREADPGTKARKALESFGDDIKKALKTFKVPGLAIAVVKDSDIIFAKGFGYRDVEKKLSVTQNTLFAIGSSSKAFTTFALGTLVDEGKVEWDKPLRNYIPWFRLQDPYMGERLTPRDLVTHRSGLPRHDLVWYNNYTASREEFVRRLAHLQPTADLRERFQYNNLMYLTAGYLVEVLTGNPWEESVRTLVFEPLNMSRTNFSVEDSKKDSDFAQPYLEKKGKLENIPFRNITNIGPAGSINSSVNEMSNWLIVHLNNGKFKDKEIINPTTLKDMHLTHMPTGNTPTRADISPADYGMGWFVDNYRGHMRIHHGGNIDGFSAFVCMFPQDHLGFVILTNKNGTPLPELAARTAADKILDLESVDWLGEAAKRLAEGEQARKKAAQKKQIRRKTGTSPAHKLDEYAGDYFHPGYGELKVFLKKNKLTFTYNGITTPLEHWHFETFNGGKADDPTFGDMKLNFQTDLNGNVAAVAAPFEPTTDEIIFTKKPDPRFYDPDYLNEFIGRYKLTAQTLTISLKGNSLTLFIPGQPVYELVPELDSEFSLKQYKVISLKFMVDKAGNVKGIELYQPNGVFEATRIKD